MFSFPSLVKAHCRSHLSFFSLCHVLSYKISRTAPTFPWWQRTSRSTPSPNLLPVGWFVLLDPSSPQTTTQCPSAETWSPTSVLWTSWRKRRRRWVMSHQNRKKRLRKTSQRRVALWATHGGNLWFSVTQPITIYTTDW